MALRRDQAVTGQQHFTRGAVTIAVSEDMTVPGRMPELLDLAERLLQHLGQMLRLPVDPVSMHVHLQVSDGASSGLHLVSRGETNQVVLLDATPVTTLVRPLIETAIGTWFGAAATGAERITNGLSGLVLAWLNAGPTAAEATAFVHAALTAGQPVSVTSSGGEAAVLDDSDYPAISFVSWLLEHEGPERLRQFLAAFDAERRDAAALAAYNQPLSALEESWLNSLRGTPGNFAAISGFFTYLLPLLKPYWLRHIELLVLMVLGLSYSLVLPLSSKYLVDTIIPNSNGRSFIQFGLILLAIYALNAGVSLRRAYVTGWISQHIMVVLAERIFTHIQRLSHEFFVRSRVGDLMTRMSNDVLVVQSAMSQVIGNAVYQTLTATAVAITLFLLSPVLCLLIICTMPLFAVPYVCLRSRLQEASYEQGKLMGEAATNAQENLAAHGLIKAFGLEQRVGAGYHARLMNLLRAGLRLMVTGSLFETSIAFAISLGELILLGAGGYMVMQDQITVGTLLASWALLPTLYMPIAAIASLGQTIQTASGSIIRLNEVLDEPVTIADRDGARPMQPFTQEIRFNDVSFGYERGLTLDHVDFSIPAGAHAAFVGPSGAGKSTIVNLLLRFWDPDSGHIVVDGQDLREVTLASLRSQIGVVFQDTFIFNTTIRENIAIGLAGATDADVVAAARAARLDTWIDSLPAHYDTVLGEHGVRMSGGQRQRLGIARVLLRDPRILIFDEASSALDPVTEAEIQQTLDAVGRGATRITVTHRLASVIGADIIFVLDGGQIVERGTHHDLVAIDGLYSRLYREQIRSRHHADPEPGMN